MQTKIQLRTKALEEPRISFFFPGCRESHSFLISKTKNLTISYSTDGSLQDIEWKAQVLNITEPHSATVEFCINPLSMLN